jgi:hypothetical protein
MMIKVPPVPAQHFTVRVVQYDFQATRILNPNSCQRMLLQNSYTLILI